MVQHLQNRQGKELLFNPTQPVVALVNALEIKSVIVNLVVNALDSMDEGGTLQITLGMRDGMAEIVFRDTGCGMSSEVLENIFEPFFTRSRSRARERAWVCRSAIGSSASIGARWRPTARGRIREASSWCVCRCSQPMKTDNTRRQ